MCVDEGTGPPGSTPPPHAGDGHSHHFQLPSHILLSELPEPPIPVSEIGPIPPPPMFSTPSPTLIGGRPHGPAIQQMNSQYQQHQHNLQSQSNQGQVDYNDYDYDGKHFVAL